MTWGRVNYQQKLFFFKSIKSNEISIRMTSLGWLIYMINELQCGSDSNVNMNVLYHEQKIRGSKGQGQADNSVIRKVLPLLEFSLHSESA